MNFTEILTAIGIPSIIIGVIYIGRKLQVLDDLKSATTKIKANVKAIGDFLTRDNINFDPSELQAYSPLKLTPKGESFIKSIGFGSVFLLHKKDFFDRDKYLEEHKNIIE